MAQFESRSPKRKGGVWWDLLKLEVGKSSRGWLAGPAIGVECHFVEHACKPCRREFTFDALPCPYCLDGIEPRFRCYVPMWDEEGKRTLVIMGDRYWALVRDLAPLTPVKATKTRARGTPLCVGASTWTTARPPIPVADQVPQDITGVLLTMWGDNVLKEWCVAEQVRRLADAPAAPSKPPRKRPVAKVPESDEELGERLPSGWAGQVAEKLAAAELFPNLAARIAASNEGPPNGVHRKAKPK